MAKEVPIKVETFYETLDGYQPKTIHRVPWFAPVVFASIVVGTAGILFAFEPRLVPPAQEKLTTLIGSRDFPYMCWAVVVAGLASAIGGFVYEVFRKRIAKPPPLYRRINRAMLYAFALLLAFAAWRLIEAPLEARLLFDRPLLFTLVAYGVWFALAGVIFLLFLRLPSSWTPTNEHELPSFRRQVASLANSYDLVLGTAREDWKRAETGKPRWLTIPEDALWMNLLIFGGTGSGKTSFVARPLLRQLLSKYPNDPNRAPSVVLLDVKGDMIEWVWEDARQFGRENDCYFIRPGNCLLRHDGTDLVPRDRFFKTNEIGGDEKAALRATYLSDGFSTLTKKASEDFFRNVELSFLISAFEAIEAVDGEGTVNLATLFTFVSDARYRAAVGASPLVKDRAPAAAAYFATFAQKDQKEQDYALTNLEARLRTMTNDAVKETLCAEADDPRLLPPLDELLLEKSSIVVLSVPEGQYSETLSKVINTLFMLRFQREMLRRSDSSFKASGGNTERLALLIADEASKFMNDSFAKYTAVNRQARAPIVALTQSITQVPPDFRSTALGNFRNQIAMAANEPETKKYFEELFGKVKRFKVTTSKSENVSKVRHGFFAGFAGNHDQGGSVSVSVQEDMVPRFTADELQALPAATAVASIYAEGSYWPSTAFETTPYWKPRYHLGHPYMHPLGRCPKTKPAGPHAFVEDDGGAYVCSLCGAKMDADDAPEIRSLFEDANMVSPV